MYGFYIYSLKSSSVTYFILYFFISYSFTSVFSKDELFDYLCAVQKLSHAQLCHNI